jgi:hypothetical protein
MSIFAEHNSESSSVGRARPCQGRGREFESRLSLRSLLIGRLLFLKGLTPAQMVELVDTQDLKSCDLKSRAGSIPALSTVKESKKKPDTFVSGFFLLLWV